MYKTQTYNFDRKVWQQVMNKGDTPPRSIQDEEEYLQEEADIKEVEEELEDGEIEIEWDGSEAELVPDEDAE